MDKPLNEVPDYIRPGLKILFVGFNPSIRSGETGHHFANPSNRFWKILYRSGLTPRQYKPEEGPYLLDLGFGLTNIVARPSRAAADISRIEYARGREALLDKIRKYRPLVVCYVGKGVYQAFSTQKLVPWGLQPVQMLDGVNDFVAPSSSGLLRIIGPDIDAVYQQIAQIIVSH